MAMGPGVIWDMASNIQELQIRKPRVLVHHHVPDEGDDGIATAERKKRLFVGTLLPVPVKYPCEQSS